MIKERKKKRPVRSPIETTKPRRKSHEYEELMRPLSSYSTRKRPKHHLPSSSDSSSDSDSGYKLRHSKGKR